MGVIDDEPMIGVGQSSLAKPLLSKVSTESSETDSDVSVETETKIDFPFLLATATTLLVVGGVATSAVAMISAQAVAVYVAGGLCVLNSPSVAVRQFKLVKGGAKRRIVNKLIGQLEELKEGEKILSMTIVDLQEEVDCLHDIEEELEGIAREQKMASAEIVSLVNENERVLAQMRNNLREWALADITRIVLSCDRSGDMSINLKELKELTLRMKIELGERGIDLDEEQFATLVRKDNDISQVLKVIAAIMFDETIDDRTLSEYIEEAHEEEQRQDDLVGSLLIGGATLARFRRLASANKDDPDEVIAELGTMFTLHDRYTRGSVDVARGTRMTLSSKSLGPPSRSSSIMRQTLNIIETNWPSMHQAIEQNKKRREGLKREKEVRDLGQTV